jgi:hypothetical protein
MLLQDQDAVEGGAGRLKRVVSLNTHIVNTYKCSYIKVYCYFEQRALVYSYTDELIQNCSKNFQLTQECVYTHERGL